MTVAVADPTTDLAEYDRHQGELFPVASPRMPSAPKLSEWAQEARAAAQIAVSLVKTSFVPDHFRNKPEEATAAILTGHEMGLSPMASLRAIYLIKGTPAMYAKTLRAIVQSHGHRMWVESASATRVVVKGQRKGSSEVESSVWTLDRAKTADLLTNAQYRKNPQNMLTARATSEVAWLVASDALHGIGCVEELDDTAAEGGTVTELAPVRKTAKRKSLERLPSAEPDPEPMPSAPTAGEAAVDADGPASGEQLSEVKRLSALAEMDVEALMQFATDKLGRFVAAPKDLTAADVDIITEALERYIAQQEPEAVA